MFRIPKVALQLEASTQFGRGLLRGIIRYSQLHGPWCLYRGAADLEQGLPKSVEFTGVIARICSLAQAKEIRAKGLPAVVIEAATAGLAAADPFTQFCEIRVDAKAVADMVIGHFAENGVGNFAFCGFENAPWSLNREESFRRTMVEKGKPALIHRIHLRNWMRHGDWVRTYVREHCRLLNWLKSLPRPTGVMACNDLCGLRVLEACADAGIRVPAHLGVVGVDDDELMCELSQPPLSSIALDVERGGYEAARLLNELMTNHRAREKRFVMVSPLRVVARRSSDLAFHDDPLVADALRFITDHAGHSIGVPNVVAEMGVSRRTLERRFLQAVGRSVLAEINRCRFDRAKCLLQETSLPLARIATEAGFSNRGMFNRIFRSETGLAPRIFRRHLHQETTVEKLAAKNVARRAP